MTPERARLYGLKAHGELKYGDLPYEYHLQKVCDVIEEFSHLLDDPSFLLTCAWLHDAIEDTPITFRDIFEEFGREVARTVYAVTNEPGANRAERAERTYPKIMAAGRNAIALKLADRIANVEHSLKHNHGMFKKYRKEYSHFRESLKLPGELKDMWARLDILMETKIED